MRQAFAEPAQGAHSMTSLRVAFYLRVSTGEQTNHGVSLEAQPVMVAAYAGLYGLELAAVVEDAGVSAKTLECPGLQSVLGMIRRGDVEAVVWRSWTDLRDRCGRGAAAPELQRGIDQHLALHDP